MRKKLNSNLEIILPVLAVPSVQMTGKVQLGEGEVVTNQGNDRTQDCVVVSVQARLAHGSSIALKFSTPMPQFWYELEIGKSPAL